MWPALEPQFEQAFEPQPSEAAAAGVDQWLAPVRRRLEPAWKLPEVAAVPGQRAAREIEDETRTVDYYWVGTEARIAGTAVHRWLQYAVQSGVGADVLADEDRSETTEQWLRELGVAPGDTLARIQGRVEAALRGVLEDEKGRWLLSGGGHAELALSGAVGGAIESGILDRVRVDDDGTHWIVDYKTSTHEGGNLDGFLAAEADRYRDQLARYSALYRGYREADVRCALYFPLLQAFVEVDIGR